MRTRPSIPKTKDQIGCPVRLFMLKHYVIRGSYMVSIQFWVGDALPPRNAGTASMWSTPGEAARLVRFCLAAAQAMNGSPRLTQNVRLRLMIFSNDRHPLSVSELAGYVPGIWNGLMSPPADATLDSIWRKQRLAHIYPTKIIAFANDAAVMGISVEKVPANGPRPIYRVTLEDGKKAESVGPPPQPAFIHFHRPATKGGPPEVCWTFPRKFDERPLS